MDRRSFEKAVQRARRWRERIEASFKTEAEMYAKLGRNAAEEAAIRPGQFPYWIQQSEGNRNIWDGLNLIAQETLRSRKPLPDALASWVADVLAEERPRPKLRGSRRPGQLSSGGPNFLQNHLIVTAIDILATKGYSPPERNTTRGSRCCFAGGSVCDAVGVAFDVLGYKKVAGLWREYKNSEKALGRVVGRPRPKRRVPRRHRRVMAAIETLEQEPPADPREQRRALAVLKKAQEE